MVELMYEYLLCNRVFTNVKKVNSLLQTVYAILNVDSKPKKVKRGWIKKTKNFRVVIRAVAWNINFGEFKIRVYDDDKKLLKTHDRLIVVDPVPKMEQVRANVILFSRW